MYHLNRLLTSLGTTNCLSFLELEVCKMMELVIDSIRVSLLNHQRVVILKQKDTERYLPIWIGPPEADAIAVRLQEVSAGP